MTNRQVENIVRFVFTFHGDLGVNLLETSPDYIKENWVRYIGDLPKCDFEKSNLIKRWDSIWNSGNLDEIGAVVSFIIEINSVGMHIMSIPIIMDMFQSKFGDSISPKDICVNNLHFLVRQRMSNWMEITENKREYNIYQTLSN